MIKTIRRYLRWNFLTSSTFEVQLELTVEITNKPDYILLPSGSYRGDLKIINLKKEELIIISDEEFETRYGVSMPDLNAGFIEKISHGLNDEQKNILLKKHRVIAVLLPKNNEDEYFEKITMTWISEFPHQRKVGNIETVELPIFVHRYDLNNHQKCAVYVSVKTTAPYRILENLRFVNLFDRQSHPEFTKILEDDMHKIYRLKETMTDQLLVFYINLAISKHISDWARFSFVGCVIVPFFILGLTMYFQKIPLFSFELLSALIAFLIGQKALVSKDAKLMKQLDHSHLATIIGISLFILALIFFSSLGLIAQPGGIYAS